MIGKRKSVYITLYIIQIGCVKKIYRRPKNHSKIWGSSQKLMNRT